MTNPPRSRTFLERACRRLRRAGRAGLMLAFFLLAAVLPTAASARAQAGPSIELLEIVLWPEYDRPAVLVIYRVTLSPDTALPTQLTLPIPAAAGEPHAVATGTTGGELFLTNYTRAVEGDWARLTIDVDQPGVQVEFYMDLELSGARRDYIFTWPGGMELSSMTYEVQTPFGADGLAVTPPGAARDREDGLTYIEGDLGPQEASSSVQISITYSKSSPGVTVDALQPTGPLEPAGSEGALTSGLTSWLPWAAGALGVVLVAGGAVLYWRMNQSPAERRSRPRQRPARGRGARAGEIDASPMFCHVCGTQAAVSDRFCRRCGARLRQ